MVYWHRNGTVKGRGKVTALILINFTNNLAKEAANGNKRVIRKKWAGVGGTDMKTAEENLIIYYFNDRRGLV